MSITQFRGSYYYQQQHNGCYKYNTCSVPTALPVSVPPLHSYSHSSPILSSNLNLHPLGLGRKRRLVLETPLLLSSVVIRRRRRRIRNGIFVASSSAAPIWESWKPQKGSSDPSLSDILWPSAGAFAAMAILGKMDQILSPKGLSITIAPLGAVCAVLFASPSTPAARKYNMFMAQIGCAAIGVLAFSIFGPGWLAKSAGLAASIAFMIYARAPHPPAASLPILFIDGVKFQSLNFWYALFPGAAGCIILCLIQEIVCYLKDNVKF